MQETNQHKETNEQICEVLDKLRELRDETEEEAIFADHAKHDLLFSYFKGKKMGLIRAIALLVEVIDGVA